VNLFRQSDFSDRYEVLANGEFADGEWARVLIDPSAFTPPPPRDTEIRQAIRALSRLRTHFISALASEDRPVGIWEPLARELL